MDETEFRIAGKTRSRRLCPHALCHRYRLQARRVGDRNPDRGSRRAPPDAAADLIRKPRPFLRGCSPSGTASIGGARSKGRARTTV
jgi:hypothetical protein